VGVNVVNPKIYLESADERINFLTFTVLLGSGAMGDYVGGILRQKDLEL
jgi:hypothetical protein